MNSTLNLEKERTRFKVFSLIYLMVGIGSNYDTSEHTESYYQFGHENLFGQNSSINQWLTRCIKIKTLRMLIANTEKKYVFPGALKFIGNKYIYRFFFPLFIMIS